MRGREFLRASRQLLSGGDEPFWRAAVVQAYYALFLECRDVVATWGAAAPPRHRPHNWVRLKLQFAKNADLKQLGDTLEALLRLRNLASYNLGSFPVFSSNAVAAQLSRMLTRCSCCSMQSMQTPPGG